MADLAYVALILGGFLVCALGTARPTGERSQMTVAGVVSVVLIAVAAALVIYLLVALVDPERF